MKTRNGFVSNSSSSSYVVFGVCLPSGWLMRKIGETPALLEKVKTCSGPLGKCCDGLSPEEILDKFPNDILSEMNFTCNNKGDYYWGYNPFYAMALDETKRQFIERVEAEARALFGPLFKCQLHTFTVESY